MSPETRIRTVPVVDRFADLVERAQFDEVTQLFTDDALFDAHVPNWRFQVQGAADIAAQLETWFQAPGRFTRLEVESLGGDDLLVQLEWREHVGEPEEIVVHDLEVWRMAEDLISQQTVFCAGRWDRDLVGQMAAEAPLVRP